jgi:hypothetical protein
LVLCISQTVSALYWVVGPRWDAIANTVVTPVAIFHSYLDNQMILSQLGWYLIWYLVNFISQMISNLHHARALAVVCL